MPDEIKIDEHLTLRCLRLEDAAELFALTDKNRKRLEPWMPWIEGVRAVEDSEKFIEGVIREWDSTPFYGYGMFYDGRLSGHISLAQLPEDTSPQIGYWIDESIEGKGLTTECVKVLTYLGLNTIGIKKIIIRAKPNNHASNRVAEKCGYTFEETRDYPERGPLNVWTISS